MKSADLFWTGLVLGLGTSLFIWMPRSQATAPKQSCVLSIPRQSEAITVTLTFLAPEHAPGLVEENGEENRETTETRTYNAGTEIKVNINSVLYERQLIKAEWKIESELREHINTLLPTSPKPETLQPSVPSLICSEYVS